MDKLLSIDDVEKIVGEPVKLVIYDDLTKVKTVEELFDGYRFILLLYRTGERVGHWCGMKRINNKLLFFDSLGFSVDDELGFTPINYKAELSRILYYSPYEVHYNDFKLQKDELGINTCGRWVGVFLVYCTDIELFGQIFEHYSNIIDLDYLVYLLTKNIC